MKELLYYNWAPTIADHIIDLPKESYDGHCTPKHSYPPFIPGNVKYADIVYVKPDLIDSFFQQSYHHIQQKFIMLTTGAALNIPAWCEQALKDKVLFWVGTNIPWVNEQTFKLPIGFEEKELKGGKQDVLYNAYMTEYTKINKIAMTYMSDTHESRKELDQLKKQNFINVLPKLEFSDYLNEMGKHKFVLCPRGFGMDTHRFWETLLVKSIPIVEHSLLDDLYSKFPCIIVNSFNDITEDMLNRHVENTLTFDDMLFTTPLRETIIDLKHQPFMSHENINVFYKYLDKCTNFWEFGSGGSTYQASRRESIKHIHSVESDFEWHNKLKQMITSDNINYLTIDLETKPNTWGEPGEGTRHEDWIKYSRAFKGHEYVDLILIDGRFRVACALNCFKEMDDQCVLLIDDFVERPFYHKVLDFFDVVEKSSSLIVLKKKINITPPPQTMIEFYECDSR